MHPPAGLESTAALLHDAEAGVVGAADRLFAVLYRDLHRLAERQLRGNQGEISPTTLLHETYLGMAKRTTEFPDRSRFMGYASRVMRSLIVDFARQRRAQKRGADFRITRLDTRAAERPSADADASTLERLSDAIDALAAQDVRLAEVVDLKYFCGFSFVEIAALRCVSERTVERDWDKARILLYDALADTCGPAQ